MSAREEIFGRLRRSLAVPSDDTARKDAVAARLSATPTGVLPARGHLPDEERIALFEAYAIKAAATVERLASAADIAPAVASYLKARNLPASIRAGADPLLAGAGWEKTPQLECLPGPSDGSDLAGLSHALAGVAETATLLLESGADNPTTINFLPEHHLVVVRASDIVADMETAFAAVKARHGKGRMPRVVNLVTGPSRSGDIEQTILLGAHGPRALHIMIVGA